MINILDKKDCCGCNACGDACGKHAITFVADNEGFWYPQVDKARCVDCGLCERVCPMLHEEDLRGHGQHHPQVYAAIANDVVVRFDSTSGGLFSVLAQAMYKRGGYVGGAVYTDTFDVKNYISNDKHDLRRLRSSKYVQSYAEGLYARIKKILLAGEQMLICGSPCQMAALRKYLGKDYDNLIIVDFLCRATNSPKVFHKYLDELAMRYGAPVAAVKDKNKDHGWRSLARKITFANGKVYYGEGHEDDYRRGYHLNVYERPSCYSCRFKGLPRIADITLGDFWGIEHVAPELDHNLGTSLVMVNTDKGAHFFDGVCQKLTLKAVDLDKALRGNGPVILGNPLPYPKGIERGAFFRAIDERPFSECAAEFFPYKDERSLGARQMVKRVLRMAYDNRIPSQLCRFVRWNVLSRCVKSAICRGAFLDVRSRCAIDLASSSTISMKGRVSLNIKRTRGSRGEFRLLLEDNAKLVFGQGHSYFKNDSDIQLFRGARMEIGSCGANMGLKIVCSCLIKMGEDVHIGRDVWIRDNNGGHTIVIKGYKDKAPVVIGNHVWICSNVHITKGVTIGDGSVISANSVVMSNIPAHCIAAGNPARVVAENVYWQP